MFLTYYHVKVS